MVVKEVCVGEDSVVGEDLDTRAGRERGPCSWTI